MRALVLLVVLSGCGTGMTWSGMGPPPVPLRPGVGLPLPVHPGEGERPRLPPSLNKRILPATREPGIWAADETKGSLPPWLTEPPVVVDVTLPYSPDAKGLEDELPTRWCAAKINVLEGSELGKAVKRISRWERMCLFAMLYEACTERPDNAPLFGVSLERNHALRAAGQTAAKFATEKCTERTRTESVVDLETLIKPRLLGSGRLEGGR